MPLPGLMLLVELVGVRHVIRQYITTEVQRSEANTASGEFHGDYPCYIA